MNKRVIGVGGIFFKCKQPKETREWYGKHLGLVTNDYGSTFEFRNAEKPEEKNFWQWSTFSEDTKHMEPSKSDFMINYRVDDLEKLVAQFGVGSNVIKKLVGSAQIALFLQQTLVGLDDILSSQQIRRYRTNIAGHLSAILRSPRQLY